MAKKSKKSSADTTQVSTAEERNVEYYLLKISDLSDKLERFKSKSELLLKENEILAKAQSKFYTDKQDIVEFLNIKVGEHEKMISSLEQKNKILEKEKKELVEQHELKYDSLYQSTNSEIEQLKTSCAKYKVELNSLSDFSEQKNSIESQIIQLKSLLERKENEYRETVHKLERKALQDKSQMKREMLQKVNEAVANFRRVADQQMAETTKRAIRENLAISSQLKKISVKTVELIAENEMLTEKVKKLKSTNSLLVDSEKEMSKMNNGNQKVIKLLVEKLKEGDQILELTFNGEKIDEEPKNLDINNGEILTTEMKQEISELQSDYNFLVQRVIDTSVVTGKILDVLQEAVNGKQKYSNQVVLDYMLSNIISLAKRAHDLVTVHQLEDSSHSSNSLVPEYEFSILSANSKGTASIMEESLESSPKPPIEEIPATLKTFTKKPTTPKSKITKYQLKTEQNFLEVIKPNAHFISQEKYMDGITSTACQTDPLPFSQPITAQYLLGEVREWKSKSLFLPKKGTGLYHARMVPRIPSKKSLELVVANSKSPSGSKGF